MQGPAEQPVPKNAPQHQGQSITHPGVGTANAENQKDPYPKQGQNKQQVSQPPGPEGPQKAVEKAQAASEQDTLE